MLSKVTKCVQHVILPAVDLNTTQRFEARELSHSANIHSEEHSCSQVIQLPHVLCCAEATTRSHLLGQGACQDGQSMSSTDLKRLLAWQTLPLAVYSILNSKDISHDRLNSFSGSGMMDSIAFLTAGMKNSTCGNGDM